MTSLQLINKWALSLATYYSDQVRYLHLLIYFTCNNSSALSFLELPWCQLCVYLIPLPEIAHQVFSLPNKTHCHWSGAVYDPRSVATLGWLPFRFYQPF